MTNKDVIEQQIKEADEFLKQVSMTSRIDKFWLSKKAQVTVNKTYESFQDEMTHYLQYALEELKGIGEELKSGTKKYLFFAEAKNKFKLRIVTTIKTLMNVLEEKDGKKLCHDVITVDGMLKDLNEVCNEMKKSCIQKFITILVIKSRPASEVEEILSGNDKNIVITLETFFPGLLDSDDDNASKITDSNEA